MYQYDQYDQDLVNERVIQFKDQTQRFLDGELTPEDFRPLRLQNGLYIQRYAPMLRIAVPYGLISSQQLRQLAHITLKYDKGYAHISTRQNFQINWPNIEQVPAILADLAAVQMHAIQTSGNCIRNVTTDEFAGVAYDEVIDPRPWCEIIRQWSTFHPEFAYLPRKFKIAVNGSKEDRAAIEVHDIGLYAIHNTHGDIGFTFYVGGGLGRTPVLGSIIEEFVPWQHMLSYLEAILRVYNRYGRRDNKYKARIKILVKAMGIETFKKDVENEWASLKDGPSTLTQSEVNRVKRCFTQQEYRHLPSASDSIKRLCMEHPKFALWCRRNTHDHKQMGYKSVVVSLKQTGIPPGDINANQMLVLADLTDQYSFGELRTTHQQNMVLADVEESLLFELWQSLSQLHLATPTVGLLTDIICCPGGDFCSLANAKSIPVAEAIQKRFDDLDYLFDIGELDLNISGCMNACGHHHVGNIGILGVDKKGEEFYQISLGGHSQQNARLGEIIGPSFARDDVIPVIEKILEVYIAKRLPDEQFNDTYKRVGMTVFKERVYAQNS